MKLKCAYVDKVIEHTYANNGIKTVDSANTDCTFWQMDVRRRHTNITTHPVKCNLSHTAPYIYFTYCST